MCLEAGLSPMGRINTGGAVGVAVAASCCSGLPDLNPNSGQLLDSCTSYNLTPCLKIRVSISTLGTMTP